MTRAILATVSLFLVWSAGFTGGAMAQTEDRTAEEMKAEAARLTAEAELITARVALARAKATEEAASDPALARLNAAKARSEAEEAAYKAAREAADARWAASSAGRLMALAETMPESGLTGAVDAKTDAGKAEATLLSARSLQAAAGRIARKITGIEPSSGRVILLRDGDLTFQNLTNYRVRKELLSRTFKDAESKHKAAEEVEGRVDPGVPGIQRESVAAVLAGTAAGLEALGRIGSFFQSDYTIGGITLALENTLLEASVAEALREGGKIEVVVPRLTAGFVSDTGLNELIPESGPIGNARGRRPIAADRVARYEKALADLAPGSGDRETVEVLLELWRAADAAWAAALEEYASLMKDLATPDANGKLMLTRVVEEKKLHDALSGSGAMGLVLDIESAAGAYYTKKNLWTFFGGMPYYAMGGVVVRYVLLETVDGEYLVKESGLEVVHGGYQKVNDVPEAIRKGME